MEEKNDIFKKNKKSEKQIVSRFLYSLRDSNPGPID